MEEFVHKAKSCFHQIILCWIIHYWKNLYIKPSYQPGLILQISLFYFSIYNRWGVAFWRAADESWTSLSIDYSFSDIMLYKGQFYGVHSWGEIFCFQLNHNANAPTYLSILDRMDFQSHRLVESVEGDFLLVGYHFTSYPYDTINLSNIEIYKLDLTSKAWEKLNDLSGQTLILCEGCCACVQTSAFTTSKYPIYFDEVGRKSFRLICILLKSRELSCFITRMARNSYRFFGNFIFI